MTEGQDGIQGDGIEAVGLAEWLHRRSLTDPDRPALTFAGTTMDYATLNGRSADLAALFGARGVAAGDRVAWLGFNHGMQLVALFACARLGAILVPMNFRLTAPELAFILDDTQPRLIVADPAHRAVIDGLRPELGRALFLTVDEDADGWERIAPDGPGGDAAPPPGIDPRSTAVIMYTSGTTGHPKGAELSHAALWANNLNWLLSIGVNSGDVGYNCAPLFHVGGLCVVVLPVLMAGGHVLLDNGFDPDRFLRTLVDRRVTLTFAVPAMMQTLAQLPGFDTADLSALRLFIAGGASVPRPLLERFSTRGIPISQGWGMTESATAVTFLSPDYALAKLGSCGKAVMLSRFRIVDAQGRQVDEPNIPGEVRLRGTNLMRGYWRRPDAARAAFDEDGWFRSGDVGYVDADGFLYICDRLKDMIITGGENVYSAEVEGALFAHPAILEAAVIGAPDPQWGERIVAFVALKPGATLDLEQLRLFAGDRLARYKLPKELHLLPALPRNSSGKLLKHELRKSIAQQE